MHESLSGLHKCFAEKKIESFAASSCKDEMSSKKCMGNG
jgi:hypothetical protein